MKIGIDARFLTHPQLGGFKTYTENLIAALIRVDTENRYFLYVDRAPKYQGVLQASSNFEIRVVSGLLPIIGMPLREQFGLVRQAAKDQIDILHSPCLTAPLYLSCPSVVTVHDMIWAFPERFSKNSNWSLQWKLMEWYNHTMPYHAIRRASAIITVSHAAKSSIVEHLDLSADKVFVTYEAASPSFKKISDNNLIDALRKKYNLDSSYILAIGSADPRKNIDALVHAYGLLPNGLKGKYQLVIVWTHSLLTERLSRQIEGLGLANRVKFLIQVPTEDLIVLYNAASLFVFPSLYEGFGLPPVEAMACGTPVVAANNSSIPEIAGDAAILFDAGNIEHISASMSMVLTDDKVRTGLIKRGFEHSSSFSWDRCALETVAVYEKIITRH